ncbi:hypothetical protein LUZ63_011486 [Rhynchospora breviuscula]|uniref:Ycf20-like protein n=1 Tax=Rhynchospora breviuscula TaxID=2022672 RepID=A0A9Q0CJ50_9POAL|nr:hypothetical protein LUZ63_011486 [Rhynchospora breviuscula]
MVRSLSTSAKQQLAPWINGDCVGRRCRPLTRHRAEVRAFFKPFIRLRYQTKGYKWKPAFALNPDSAPSPNPNLGSNGDDDSPFGTTRLATLVRAAATELLTKLNSARKNFPMKIFLLLLGFYTANALATILGQTGDWDVLVAGVVVAAIEGIGMLMYGKPIDAKWVGGRLQKFVVMVNYWKAGVCLGLFVDAFKLGS